MSTLRRETAQLVDLADRDLTRLWRLVAEGASAEVALRDLLPAIITEYGTLGAALAAEWYDEQREKSAVRGRFTGIPVKADDRGAEALIGWALTEATDDTSLQSLILGGTQRRIADHVRYTVAGSAVEDPAADGWQRVGGGECHFCSMLISRGAVYSESSADFSSHDNCFPDGVLVTGPSVEVGYRRWYEGELVIVGLAGGEELPVTPNHPILTPTGWVAAGSLREGDDVIERTGADLASLQVPHEHDVPTPIEDVWGAASMDALRSVPVAAEDFHGDAGTGQGYVDVVAAHGLLPRVLDTDIVEHRAESIRSGAGAPSVLHSFSSRGDGLLPLVLTLAATDGGMCGGRQLPALTGAQLRHADSSRLGSVTDRQSRRRQPAAHDAARHAVTLRHGEHALASLIDHEQISGRFDAVVRGPSFLRPRYYSAPLQGEADPIGGLASESGRDLIERLAGGIQLRRVVQLRRRYSSGHVYNFQTTEGWYTANSVVVSNCKCSAAPAFEGRPRPVKPYTPTRRNVTDADRARVREYLRTH